MSRLFELANALRQHGAVSLAGALVAICVLVGLATGFWLLFRLAYVVGFAIPLVYLWTHSMLRGLDVEIFRRTQRVSLPQICVNITRQSCDAVDVERQ